MMALLAVPVLRLAIAQIDWVDKAVDVLSVAVGGLLAIFGSFLLFNAQRKAALEDARQDREEQRRLRREESERSGQDQLLRASEACQLALNRARHALDHLGRLEGARREKMISSVYRGEDQPRASSQTEDESAFWRLYSEFFVVFDSIRTPLLRASRELQNPAFWNKWFEMEAKRIERYGAEADSVTAQNSYVSYLMSCREQVLAFKDWLDKEIAKLQPPGGAAFDRKS